MSDSMLHGHSRHSAKGSGHRHEWQANGVSERVVTLDGGFVRARQTLAVQSCACGKVRELLVREERWRPYA
jgi:hypothetical protein